MKKIAKATALLLIVCFIFVCPLVVCASESGYDWGSIDYETFNYRSMEVDDWEAMANWLAENADLATIVEVTHHTDGWTADLLACVVAERFLTDPAAFILELTAYDEQDKDRITGFVAYGAGVSPPDRLVSVLSTLTLTGPDSEEGYEILEMIISSAESLYRVEISNPKTSDPLLIHSMLLILSAACIMLSVKQRRKFVHR